MPGVKRVDPLVEGISDRISVISRRFLLRSKRRLDEHGITWRDWQVLTNLVLSGGTPRSPTYPAPTLMVKTGPMTNMLDPPEPAGLNPRGPQPRDPRGGSPEGA